MTETVNAQDEYTKGVKTEVGKILSNVYSKIEARQKEAIENMQKETEKALKSFERKTDDCLVNCDAAVDNVKKQITEMKGINLITDFLLILAPLSVIGSFMLKLIEFFT